MVQANPQASAAARQLPIRMRKDLAVRPLQFGGRRYWGIKDPIALRYFQLRDEEYCILRMLNGRESLESLQAQFERQFAPRRVTIEQIQSFLGVLHREGLVVAETTGQADELLTRGNRSRRRAMLGSLANVLAIRFRGIDPDPFLRWVYPRCRWLFSTWCVVLCLLFVLASVILAAAGFSTLQTKLPSLDAFMTAKNVFLIAAAVVLSKVLHEFGHALTCKHFSGECHEMGFMLLVFTPVLYCNVSDSWMLRNKWHRVAISAAGIYVELFLAAVCTWLWWFSRPGLLNTFCLNMMIVCSISTIFFNGNPLLRYDGYYIFADIAEVPNLREQAGRLISRFFSLFFAGIDEVNPRMLPDRLRGLLTVYGIASMIYRWFVVIAILWFVHLILKPHRLEILSNMLAIVTISGLLLGPLMRGIGFVRDPVRSRQVKWGQLVFRGSVVVLAVVALCLVPIPYDIGAAVVLEPQDAQRVYVSVSGTLETSAVPGQPVRAGDELAVLVNLDVKMEIEKLRGQRDRQRLRLENLESRRLIDKQADEQIPAAREALADVEERLQQRLREQELLVLTAPVDGTVMSPRSQKRKPAAGELSPWSGTPLDQENAGSYLETGTIFCLVGEPDRIEPVLAIDQADIEFVHTGQRVRFFMRQSPGTVLLGTITEIAELDLEVAPPELVAGGHLPVEIDDQGVPRLLRTVYQARVALDEHATTLLAGAAGDAKIDVEPQSLGERLYRYLKRTINFEL